VAGANKGNDSGALSTNEIIYIAVGAFVVVVIVVALTAVLCHKQCHREVYDVSDKP
jgi:hypothetical protein